MAIELTDNLKAHIVLSAFGAAGPGATDGEVIAQVSRITAMLQDGSPALAVFDRAAQRSELTVDTKAFPGTVLFVDLEESSQRPIVFLKTEPSDYHPDAIEHFRLDRVDSNDATRVKALAKEATGLVGHKVLVTIAVEKAGGKNVRILRAIEDRGIDSEHDGLTLADGAALIDWTEKERAKIAPKLVRLNKVTQPA